MAYDVQRFNELAKQMSAFAHYTAAATFSWPWRVLRAAIACASSPSGSTASCGRGSATDGGLAGRLRVASELLASDYPTHPAAGRKLYADGKPAKQLAERDHRLERISRSPGPRAWHPCPCSFRQASSARMQHSGHHGLADFDCGAPSMKRT